MDSEAQPESGGVRTDRGVGYGLGKLADIYWPPSGGTDRSSAPHPLTLLWHGVGPDDRGALGPLATALAGLGLIAVVPDWRSDAPDHGRAHLLASLAFARQLPRGATHTAGGGAFVLAGWSRGGRMAASLALNPAAAGGWRPSAVVCLAAGFYQATPLSPPGRGPIDDLAVTRAAPVPFRLIHGTRDMVIGVSESRDFTAAAARHGWPAELAEPDTDHGGVIKVGRNENARRRLPLGTRLRPRAVAAGLLSAAAIAAVAGR